MLAAFMHRVNLGIIGGGTVGGGVYQAVQRNGALMMSRLGVQLRVVRRNRGWRRPKKAWPGGGETAVGVADD